jgi:hypothetical protein
MFKNRIEIGEFFGEEKANVWVEMSELSRDEVMDLKRLQGDDQATLDFIEKIFPEKITNHNFYNESGEQADTPVVIDLLKSSITLYTHVLKNMSNSPFRKATESKSDKSL